MTTAGSAQQKFLTAGDIVALPSKPPSERFAYGDDPNQFAELRMPPAGKPPAVIAVLHGGCWAEYADVSYAAPFASALLNEGWATWNIEYRRAHQSGGGYPGTFLDVGAGLDRLREAAGKHPLDLLRVIVLGHSAGGHLAAWVAARRGLPASSALSAADPLPVRGVVSMAGVVDLAAFAASGGGCADRLVRLMGGRPTDQAERYRLASPRSRLPLGVPQRLIWGAHDSIVPRSMFADYERDARERGDPVETIVLPNSAHHDMMSPAHESWPAIVRAIRSLLR